MPKTTFLNLPELKKKLLLESAAEEFSQKGYEKASVHSIACRADIAKGSLYQYFESKKDLFLYVAEYAVEKELALVSGMIGNTCEHDVFTLIRLVFQCHIRFASEHSVLFRMFQDIGRETSAELREEIGKRLYRNGYSWNKKFRRLSHIE